MNRTPNNKPVFNNVIWVVDDNSDHRELIVETLTNCDDTFEVKEYSTGENALIQLNFIASSSKPLPKLILMDVKMPRLNGIETIRSIKANSMLRSIPIVMLSTSSNEVEIRECLQSGAILYTQKPLTKNFFVTYVMPLLDE